MKRLFNLLVVIGMVIGFAHNASAACPGAWQAAGFSKGDANRDRRVNQSDIDFMIKLLNYPVLGCDATDIVGVTNAVNKTFRQRADVNRNRIVDVADLISVYNVALGIQSPSIISAGNIAQDVNWDGKVDSLDIIRVSNYLTGATRSKDTNAPIDTIKVNTRIALIAKYDINQDGMFDKHDISLVIKIAGGGKVNGGTKTRSNSG